MSDATVSIIVFELWNFENLPVQQRTLSAKTGTVFKIFLIKKMIPTVAKYANFITFNVSKLNLSNFYMPAIFVFRVILHSNGVIKNVLLG